MTVAVCGLWNQKVALKTRWPILNCNERTEAMKEACLTRRNAELHDSLRRHPNIAHDLILIDRKFNAQEAARQHGDFYFTEHTFELELVLRMINNTYSDYYHKVYVQQGVETRSYKNGVRTDRYRLPVTMPFVVHVNLDYHLKGAWLTNYVHPRSMVRLQRLGRELDFGPMVVTISNIMKAGDLLYDEGPLLGQMDNNSSVGFLTEESALLFAGMVESGMMDDEYERWSRTR